jgi:hypothetical protein
VRMVQVVYPPVTPNKTCDERVSVDVVQRP